MSEKLVYPYSSVEHLEAELDRIVREDKDHTVQKWLARLYSEAITKEHFQAGLLVELYKERKALMPEPKSAFAQALENSPTPDCPVCKVRELRPTRADLFLASCVILSVLAALIPGLWWMVFVPVVMSLIGALCLVFRASYCCFAEWRLMKVGAIALWHDRECNNDRA